jgi:hypothetical protein
MSDGKRERVQRGYVEAAGKSESQVTRVRSLLTAHEELKQCCGVPR